MQRLHSSSRNYPNAELPDHTFQQLPFDGGDGPRYGVSNTSRPRNNHKLHHLFFVDIVSWSIHRPEHKALFQSVQFYDKAVNQKPTDSP